MTKYQCTHPFAVSCIDNYFDRLTQLIDMINPSNILDLGCGEGYGIKKIMERTTAYCAHYYGLDCNVNTLRLARRILKANRFEAITGDIYTLPLRFQQFDLVLCLEVLEHLTAPEVVLQLFPNHFKGHCIFSVPHEPLYRLTRLLLFMQNIRDLGNHPEHLNQWTKKAFTNLVGRYFEIDCVFTPFPWILVLSHTK